MIADAFATLGLPRLAALVPQDIENAYFKKSKDPSEDQQALNAAYQTLVTPDRRLKHLLDLAAPTEAKSWRAVTMPEEMMRLFSRVGSFKTEAESLLKRRDASTSALGRALLEPKLLGLREGGESIAVDLFAALETLTDQLPLLDAALETHSPDAWQSVAKCQAHLAYLSKWQTQVRAILASLI
jgi:hypothetical protein